MIQAVILAGGLGTRMRPLTETVPKPMLPVLGRPFLEYQLEMLEANGITRLLLLVGYLGKMIEEYFRERTGSVPAIEYSYEPVPLGTGGAMKNAASMLDEEFLIVNGDTLLDMDYAAFVGQFRAQAVEATIAAYRNVPGTVPSNLSIDENGRVLNYQKQRPTGEYVDAGVVAARKTVLDHVPAAEKCSFEQEVFPALIAQGQLTAWRTEKPFFDMGTPAGLQALENHLRKRQSA